MFIINRYIYVDQKYPSVALTNGGDVLAVWQSYTQDGSGYGIFGCAGLPIDSADWNRDGWVDFKDYRFLARQWLMEGLELKTDLLDDNRIDKKDIALFSEQWLRPHHLRWEMDINRDRRIDFFDYAIWAAQNGMQGPLESDVTGDGFVDMSDLQAMLFYWGDNMEQ